MLRHFIECGLAQFGCHFGEHQTRNHQIGRDGFWRQFNRQRLSEPRQPRFGGGIGRVAGEATETHHRAYIDHCAAFAHVRHSGPGHIHGTREIDLQHLLPCLVGQAVYLAAAVHTRVVDQHINAAESCHDRVNRFAD